MHRTSPTRIGQVLALFAALAILATTVAAGAMRGGTDHGDQPLAAIAADGSNSANADRLTDGALGTTDASSWSNGANPWRERSYPMDAILDLGSVTHLSALRLYAGQIPFPDDARLVIEASQSGADGSYRAVAEVTGPTYDRWSQLVSLGPAGFEARFLRLSFPSMTSRFNLAEIEVFGRMQIDDDPGDDRPFDGTRISDVSVSDHQNSRHASRLVDGAKPPETGDAGSWQNPRPWRADSYPMSAEFDLGSTDRLSGVSYFVGNLNQGEDRVVFEYSTEATGDDFSPLAVVDAGHRWNDWRHVKLDGQAAQRVRIVFDNQRERFNISQVRFYTADEPTVTTNTVTPTTVSPTTGPVTTGPVTTIPGTTTSGTGEPGTSTTDPGVTTTMDGQTTTVQTTTGTTRPTTGGQNPAAGDQPKAGPPGPGIARSFGFGSWPNDHLTQTCRDLHDSYWTIGPNTEALTPALAADPEHADNKAYHTWHPAVGVNPRTGERCNFGHEHGFNPTLAPTDLFELSGGWPAFGYVAETLGGARHEDHVGHKVTVANFRASIGNGAGSEPLYDAGFECHWLSKIHQGSSSLDAFANHLHEYFLTLRCMDGLNASGQVDNTVVGTNFSIKVMYTYGKPNEFAEDGCARDDESTPNINETVFPASILMGPEGQHVHPAQRTDPLGNDKPNNRGFTCSSGVIWKDVSEIQSVDLWTQLIKIERNDGSTAITVQPYYIVKNPSRIIEAYDASAGERPSKVVRTISLCYDDAGNRLQRGFCNGAPDKEPDWRSPLSPFNGALRAVNFKSSHLQNQGGPERFCTDPFGFTVNDPLPCNPGNVMQKASSFDNHWNDGRYGHDGRTGNIQGSIWAVDPNGNRFAATPAGGGAYTPNGIGFEFIIDNRNPDDDRDGLPDGAQLLGQN